jgi:hypothetical protein
VQPGAQQTHQERDRDGGVRQVGDDQLYAALGTEPQDIRDDDDAEREDGGGRREENGP